jgi:DNA-binding beta-propeller fold protein YncE
MTNAFVRYCGTLLAIAAGACAQTSFDGAARDASLGTALSQPVMGIVFDKAQKALRPVLGVSGAAAAGVPLQLVDSLRLAAVSPAQDYILATAGGAPGVLLFRIRNGSAAPVPLPANLVAPDRIALSPSGGAAAFFYADTKSVHVLSGLPDTPSDVWALDLAGEPSVLAVSDDGRAVIASTSGSGDDQTVYWTDGVGVARLFEVGRTSAAAFLPSSRQAVLADAAGNRVLRVRPGSGSPEVLPAAGPDDGVAGPVGLAVSANGAVLVANADSRSVLTIDAAGGPPQSLTCYCTPSALVPMSASLFRLTEPDGQRLWLFDTQGAARIVFVPLAAPDGNPL